MTNTGAQLLHAAVLRLRPVLGDGAARDARVLLADALGIPADRLTLALPDPVPAPEATRFDHHITARLRRKPVSQIIGRRLFWGREFHVTADVLDPRPETESLIELALQGPPPRRILDLGLGSGCILLTLLAEFPAATGVGADLSAAACEVARGNARKLGLAGRVEILQSDWFGNITGSFDLIVSNPPYISAAEMQVLEPEVAGWEPRIALTPEGDGLGAYRKLAAGIGPYLRAGGQALFEIGRDQGPDVQKIFANAGFENPQLHQDLNGHDRVLQFFHGYSRKSG